MENLENEVRVKFGNLSLNSLRKTAVLLRAINNISRQSIISQLGTMEKPTVSDLVAVLDMEQSIVSQHLGILRRARIVTSLKKGKFVYYFVNNDRISDIQQFANIIVNC